MRCLRTRGISHFPTAENVFRVNSGSSRIVLLVIFLTFLRLPRKAAQRGRGEIFCPVGLTGRQKYATITIDPWNMFAYSVINASVC